MCALTGEPRSGNASYPLRAIICKICLVYTWRSVLPAGEKLAVTRTFALLIILLLVAACDRDEALTLRLETIHTGTLFHPAYVRPVRGSYVALELLANRVVIGSDESFSRRRHTNPEAAGQHLASPHYFATHGDGSLLVSEGWGQSIVAIDPNDFSRPWQRFRGPKGERLNAPHGICTAVDGWIYVADSLNSRLVRFRDMQGRDWQVFPDNERRIAYGRQLLCRQDGVWLANSYEKRPKLNPGTGGNILRIREFASGAAEEVAAFPNENITGLAVAKNRWLIVGLWAKQRRLAIVDLSTGRTERVPRPPELSGPPYGLHLDTDTQRLWVAYIGDIYKKQNQGGLALYRLSWGAR